MSRIPYAAEQLLTQVAAHRPEAEVTNGEPDGIGVIRSFSFDKATSRWLWPLMKDDLDARLARGELVRGVLTLTFQSRSALADDRKPFDLPAPKTLPTAKPEEQPENGEPEVVLGDEPDAEQ